jgi:hypothetical protein
MIPPWEESAMSLTRRDALAAVVGCTLTATAAGADEKPAAKPRPWRDPVLSNVPPALQSVFENVFPNHRCIRMAVRQVKDATAYRGTFFNPADTTVRSNQEGGEFVSRPLLYDLEVSDDGKIVEETPHRVLDLGRLPKPVVAAYEQWNPKGITGMFIQWWTEVPRGRDRTYRVGIVINSIKAYWASFKEDGTVIKADPSPAPSASRPSEKCCLR